MRLITRRLCLCVCGLAHPRLLRHGAPGRRTNIRARPRPRQVRQGGDRRGRGRGLGVGGRCGRRSARYRRAWHQQQITCGGRRSSRHATGRRRCSRGRPSALRRGCRAAGQLHVRHATPTPRHCWYRCRRLRAESPWRRRRRRRAHGERDRRRRRISAGISGWRVRRRARRQRWWRPWCGRTRPWREGDRRRRGRLQRGWTPQRRPRRVPAERRVGSGAAALHTHWRRRGGGFALPSRRRRRCSGKAAVRLRLQLRLRPVDPAGLCVGRVESEQQLLRLLNAPHRLGLRRKRALQRVHCVGHRPALSRRRLAQPTRRHPAPDALSRAC